MSSSKCRKLDALYNELERNEPSLTFSEILIVIDSLKNERDRSNILEDLHYELEEYYDEMGREPSSVDYPKITKIFQEVLQSNGYDKTGIMTFASKGLLIDELD